MHINVSTTDHHIATVSYIEIYYLTILQRYPLESNIYFCCIQINSSRYFRHIIQ